MKKSAKKSPASSAPASKAKPAASLSKKASPAPKVAAPAARQTSAPAPKKTGAPKKKSPGAIEPPLTLITATIDIGFGNHLYIRGEGPGLSWDHGIALDCVGNGLWTTSIKNAAVPVLFKLMLNDQTWSVGNDFEVQAGQSLTVTPEF